MKLEDFERLVSDITECKVKLFLLTNQNAKKWYEQEFKRATSIELNTIYGVVTDDGSMIDFNFKTGKNEDSLLRTFLTQYTQKVKQYELIDGEIVELNKKQKLDKIITSNKNSDRVHKGLFYTTLYGIGMFDFLNSQLVHNILHKKIDEFLKSNGVNYTNEYSDAAWVFRYKFEMPIEKTNDLLNKFKME